MWASRDEQFELVWVTFLYIIGPKYIKNMSKIKDILEKMKSTPREYHDLSLLIAKRIWLLIASLYYLSLLFTVGGFYYGPFSLDVLSLITYHLYSVLVIATVWFGYSLCEYAVAIYVPQQSWLKWAWLGIAIVFSLITLAAHLTII
jgi:hypothetical protein